MKNNDSDGGIVRVDIDYIDANGILRRDNRFYYFQDAEVQMQEVENNRWYGIAIQDADDLKNIVGITVEEAACVLGRLKEILQENIATNQWNDEKSQTKSKKYRIKINRFGRILSYILENMLFENFYERFIQMKAHEIYEMCQSDDPSTYIDNI